MKHLTIIRGTPGSGKSTLAKALFDAKLAAAICEADDFFHTAEGYKFDFAKLGQAHTVCQQQVAYLLGRGLSVMSVAPMPS
jgi:adenylate kinase family enzyme